MKAEIISVGNELLAGTTLNTNTTFLSRNLALMGYEVHRQSVIGDVESEIMETVAAASKRSHVTILTGGLGPTEDDITKESVAKVFGLSLVKSPEVEQHIEKIFKERGRDMPESNLKQAMIINGGEVLKNPNGTAPGIYLQTSTQAIILLPGPASEMEAMFENEVKKRLEAMNDVSSASASLHVFGLGESAIEEDIKDLLYGENPTAALYAKTGEVHIDLVAQAKTKIKAEEILETRISEIKERIGEFIYSEDGKSMAETVVELLKKTKTKIALAESCTGGMMASQITDIEGASRIFDYGMAAYSDITKQKELDVNSTVLKKFTSVSSATAAEMAKGARANGGADIGVGITGVAGPKSDYVNKPVGLVYIAVADSKRVIVKKFNLGSNSSRKTLRKLSVLNAFDMVRRYVLGLEIDDSRTFGEAYVADVERAGKPRKKSALVAQKTITQVLMIMAVLGGLFVGYRAVRMRANQSIYNELRSLYKDNGLMELKNQNPDTVGWLTVEGTESVNTVVVSGKDNHYVNHDFSGKANELGCLYTGFITDAETSDNIVIHGTSIDPTQMFGPLQNFADASYLSTNYMINFETLNSKCRYKVVSVLYANSNADVGSVQDFFYDGSQGFWSDNAFMEFVIQAKMRSVVNVDTDILQGDKFLTFVTDANKWDGAKLVVISRMVREGEWTEMTSAMFTNNLTAAYPDMWYELNGFFPNYNEIMERDKWLNWMLANQKNAGNQQIFRPAGGGVGAGDSSDNGVSRNKHGNIEITVYMNGVVVTDTPTVIVSQIVAYEISKFAAFNDEAIKAQAVATASWLRYCYEHTGVPDVSGMAATERIKELVDSVIQEGVYYNDKIALTSYFTSTNKRTYNSEDVWGAEMNLPYLRSVESTNDAQFVSKNSRTSTILEMEFKQRLESYYQIKLSDNRDNWLKIISTGEGGVVKKVSIDGKVEDSGINFIEKCMILNSANFTFYWLYTGSINITTEGIGHGVGMSQAGAHYYAEEQGWTYKQILQHYYTGVTIGEMNWDI